MQHSATEEITFNITAYNVTSGLELYGLFTAEIISAKDPNTGQPVSYDNFSNNKIRVRIQEPAKLYTSIETATGDSIYTTNQEFKIQLLDANITLTSGNTKPTSQATSLTAIPENPAAGLKFISAATDTGMGTYSVSPNFELEIPAQTYAGTYTSTVTITAATGP